MPQRKPIVLFLCRFVVLYVILVLPWPGWGKWYAGYFRALGRAVFASEDGPRDLSFDPLPDAEHPSATRIGIANRNMMNEGGLVPVRNLDIDALTTGWKPTALLLALVIATPIPWKRRGWALLWGVLCIHAIVLLFLGFSIWNESSEVSLVTLGPFWKRAAVGFNEFLVWQYALVMPVVVWVLVTFRKEDRKGAIGVSLFGPVAGGMGDAPEKAAAQSRKQARKKGA